MGGATTVLIARHIAGAPFTALRAWDLSVRAGELVGIVGRSGSCKPAREVITRIDRPTSGEVVVGTRVDTLSHRELALGRMRHVGVVFQLFELLPSLTIGQNVVLPRMKPGLKCQED